LDVGQDTTLSDGDAGEELVQLLVVADGQLEMAGDDPGLLVVSGSIASQFENLSSEVLHDGSQVDRGSSPDPLSVVAFSQEPMDTSDGELKSSPAGSALALPLDLSSLSSSTHVGSACTYVI